MKISLTEKQVKEYLKWLQCGRGIFYQLSFVTENGPVDILLPRVWA